MQHFATTSNVIIHKSLDESAHDFHKIHLWLCNTDSAHLSIVADNSLLSPNERKRVERLKNALERRRIAARCTFVHYIFGKLLRTEPGAVEFRIGSFGKPELSTNVSTGLPPVLRFNLAHSENILLLGVTSHGKIGVDVEIVHLDFDIMSVARDFFAPDEMIALQKLTKEEQVASFYRIWTVREAIAKAEGTGIAMKNDKRRNSCWNVYSLEFDSDGKKAVGAVAFG